MIKRSRTLAFSPSVEHAISFRCDGALQGRTTILSKAGRYSSDSLHVQILVFFLVLDEWYLLLAGFHNYVRVYFCAHDDTSRPGLKLGLYIRRSRHEAYMCKHYHLQLSSETEGQLSFTWPDVIGMNV